MRYLLIILMCLISVVACGQNVSYRVIDNVTLPNGNIQTQVEYTLPDGRVVRNDYQSIYSSYEDKTAQESQAWLQAQIDYQCDNYLKEYLKKNGLLSSADGVVTSEALKIRTPINADIIKNKLAGMKGKTGSKNYLKYKITDKGTVAYEQLNEEKVDGTVIKEITIDMEGKTKVDGTVIKEITIDMEGKTSETIITP